jgi:hypothetical protein
VLTLVALAMAGGRAGVELSIAGEKPLAWLASSVEAASMPCTSRASGSRVQAEIRGIATGGASGCAKFVTARRTNLWRPSGKATAMKAGPRAQLSESNFSCCPNRGW